MPCGWSSKGRSTRRAGTSNRSASDHQSPRRSAVQGRRKRYSMRGARMTRLPLLVEAIAIDGPQPAIRLALGEALMRTGRAADAVGHLEAAIRRWLRRQRRRSTARASARSCGPPRRSRQPTVGNARLGAAGTSGGSRARLRDAGTRAAAPCVEAIRWLQIAVQRAPDRAEAHEKLGLAFFLKGDPPTARPYLERACRPRPGERQRPPQSGCGLCRTLAGLRRPGAWR